MLVWQISKLIKPDGEEILIKILHNIFSPAKRAGYFHELYKYCCKRGL